MKTISAVALILASVGSALASPEMAQYAGSHYVTLGNPGYENRVDTVIYTNINATGSVTAGFSQAGTTATFGDNLNMIDSGVMQRFSFSLFNSAGAGNTVAMTGGTMNLSFLRQSDSSVIGGFSVNLAPILGVPGGALNPGFYTIITVNTSALALNLDTANIATRQSLTGGAGRYGIVIQPTVLIGSSDAAMFISSPATPAGNYTIGGVSAANPLYEVVIPAPGAMALLGLGGLVATRRRR